MDRATKTQDVAVGVIVAGTRVVATVGRVALLPVRVAARMPLVGPALRRTGESLAAEGHEARAQARHRLETTAEGVLASPEVEHTVDVAMAGPLTDAVARSLAEHQVVERIAEQVLAEADLEGAVTKALGHERTERLVAEALASPDLERLLASAIESRLTVELTDRVLDSPEMQRAVDHVAASPMVRAALARQTTTLADEMVGSLRRRAEGADESAERAVRGLLRRPPRLRTSSSAEGQLYAGVATRAAALAIDVAIAHLIFLTGAALLGLTASLVGELRPEWLVAVLVASGWAVVVGGYFVLFWTTAGQTPGMRLMRLRVAARGSGGPPRLGRALLRLLGLGLAIVPLFAGFLPVLFNERRRGLHDFLGDTVVVHAERPPLSTEGVEIRGEPAREMMSRA
jgi:uncharacterized RDD family membrane protein YckC